MLKLIITGTGRCGTTYLAKLVTSMGLKCGHESIFDYSEENVIKERLLNPDKRVLSLVSSRDSQWINPKEIDAESSYLAAPYLDWKELNNTKIIHVYRNPLNVIRSFLLDFKYFNKNHPDTKNIFNELGFEQKIWAVLPTLREIKTPIERACYFYYKWNEMIENKSNNKQVLKIKIEDENKIEKIKKFLELQENNDLFNNEKENSFDKGKKIKLEDIPAGRIKNKFIELINKLNY